MDEEHDDFLVLSDPTQSPAVTALQRRELFTSRELPFHDNSSDGGASGAEPRLRNRQRFQQRFGFLEN